MPKAERQGRPVAVRASFAPLLRWVLAWWQGDTLPLALDATAHGDQVVALVISVLYRGTALPVAWAIHPANQPGRWRDSFLELVQALAPAVPSRMTVVLMTDRGLWSPGLWQTLRQHGWHPLMRLQGHTPIVPVGQGRQTAQDLVGGPGRGWVGPATVFAREHQRHATVLVVWLAGHAEPWVLLTDLPPARVGLLWYGLRAWIELGFRALKSVAWQWHHTRRLDPERVARHWLVLAVAQLWAVAVGTDLEAVLTTPPALTPERDVPPPAPVATPGAPPPRPRRVSLVRLGILGFQQALARDALPRALALHPEPLPLPPPGVTIVYHQPTEAAA
jgi:DDE family transposase